MAMQSFTPHVVRSQELGDEFKAHKYPNYWKVLATQANKQEIKMWRVPCATRKASTGNVAKGKA